MSDSVEQVEHQAMLDALGLKRTEVPDEVFEKIAGACNDLLEIAQQAGFAMFISATARNTEGSFGLIHSHCTSEALFAEEAPGVVKMIAGVARTEQLQASDIPFEVQMSINGIPAFHVEYGSEEQKEDAA